MKTYAEFMETYIDRNCLAMLRYALQEMVNEFSTSVRPYVGMIGEMGDEFAPDYDVVIFTLRVQVEALAESNVEGCIRYNPPKNARHAFATIVDAVKSTLQAAHAWRIDAGTDAGHALSKALRAAGNAAKVFCLKPEVAHESF